MIYYEVAILNIALNVLTYKSEVHYEVGDEVLVTLKGNKNLLGVIISIIENEPSFEPSNILKNTGRFFSTLMCGLSKFISSYYVCNLGQALGLFTPFVKKNNFLKNEIIISSDFILSQVQSKIYEQIVNTNISLLFAATGSGKTEIYIKAMIDILNQNKQSLLLMPEISLTPQMEKRLKVIFGDSVGIWHSKVTKKKKDEILNGLQNGTIKIIAGARSALFLPFSNLGLIVVDEEHDESYKSDKTPRVNVKDLAIYIGSKYNIKVILGSATPSLSSYKKIKNIRLKETFFETNKKFIFDESPLGVSDIILQKIQNTLNNKKQSIVFLPTRANFRYQICDTCGKTVECPFCSVSMSLHKNSKALKCHYCGFSSYIPDSCPSCHKGIIKNFRIGTAEVVSILQEKFADKNIVKFDRDAIKTEKELKKILSSFNDGKIDILVGTQMLSKGHDYHNVTLAVVLGIDSILSINSYRSREKAMSLLVQLSGRSGRSGLGEVLIQTQNKDFFEHYLINNDYESFIQDELEYRKKLYPPFVKIAKIYFSHTNFEIAKRNMNSAIEILKQEPVEIVGFGEAQIFKVANKYRYEIFVRSNNINNMLNAIHKTKKLGSVDMDCIL